MIKSLAIAAALVVGAGAFAGAALAQNGPATGNEAPVAGGAGGGGAPTTGKAMTKHSMMKHKKKESGAPS